MKVQQVENATPIHVIYINPLRGMCQQRREANFIDTLIVPLHSLSFFYKKPLQGYQVVQLQYFRPPSKDGDGWEQPCGMDPAEVTDSWGQLKSVREEQNVSTIEVQSKLDQLKL